MTVEASHDPIPQQTGIGLRSNHYREVLRTRPEIPWLEIHSENYFCTGGPYLHFLDAVRELYPISLHGVGLSLGSTDPLDRGHLAKLKTLITRCRPGLVSEHLSWSSVAGRHANDLLPLPYTEEALRNIVLRIDQIQDHLGHMILIENISSYLGFTHSTITEWEFLTAISRQTGCGILLDVNNVYVSSKNLKFNPYSYIQSVPSHAIQEIHLAGFHDAGTRLIDTHGKPVSDEVWNLFRHALQHHGPKPTLIEWDTDIPPMQVLLQEASKAQSILDDIHYAAA